MNINFVIAMFICNDRKLLEHEFDVYQVFGAVYVNDFNFNSNHLLA